jgi:hypothetical protein
MFGDEADASPRELARRPCRASGRTNHHDFGKEMGL